MTDAQKEARAKVRLILDEHFTGWVLVMLGDEDEDNDESAPMSWGGGYALAVGLLEIGREAMKDLKAANE